MARRNRSSSRPGAFGRLVRAGIAAVVGLGATYYGVAALCLLLCNVVVPPTTGVQMQRRVEALVAGTPYQKRQTIVPMARLSPHLAHAVVAAEDGRFYEHAGVDWEAVRKAIEDNRRRGEAYRGGSTITQQLVKNLFMTTHSSYVRKALELPLTYQAELLLSKDRILELYLNVIEWGPGIYGAEAAARHHVGTGADGVGRYQAAQLAALIPNPRERTLGNSGWYADIISRRMRQMGY